MVESAIRRVDSSAFPLRLPGILALWAVRVALPCNRLERDLNLKKLPARITELENPLVVQSAALKERRALSGPTVSPSDPTHPLCNRRTTDHGSKPSAPATPPTASPQVPLPPPKAVAPPTVTSPQNDRVPKHTKLSERHSCWMV